MSAVTNFASTITSSGLCPAAPRATELKNGKVKTEVTVSVADLKRDLEKYLSDFTKTRPFPNPLPEIKLDKLAVVAFVQDDNDKNIVHAVSVPVDRAAVTPAGGLPRK